MSGFTQCEPEPTHVYISGPMRGIDGYNFPAFFEAEGALFSRYAEAVVCNPARTDIHRFGLHEMLAADPTGLAAGRYLQNGPGVFGEAELRAALAADLEFICSECDLVVVLPGWEKSKGARCEVATARALGIKVVKFDPATVIVSEEYETALRHVEPFRDLDPEPYADLDPAVMVWRDATDEVRVTSPTGGEKGSKLAAFDQISPEVERLVAEHFGKGARKYSAHNFRNGYPWSLSYSALRRHLAAFWEGEEYDNHLPSCPEGCTDHTGSLHIVAVIWHAMVLTEFFLHQKEYDDRYVYESH